MREEPVHPPTRPRRRARAITAAVVLLAATQVGGCFCEKDRKPGDPTGAQEDVVDANLDAVKTALYEQRDCRRARMALAIAVTEHATWQKPGYDGYDARIGYWRDAVKRQCPTSGTSTMTTPAAPSAATPAPTGTSTRRTPTATGTVPVPVPVPTPTAETPPAVTPTSEQEAPPVEPESGSSGELPAD